MMYKQSNKANKQTLRKIKTYAKQSHLPTDKIFMGASGGKAAKEKEKNNIMNAPTVAEDLSAIYSAWIRRRSSTQPRALHFNFGSSGLIDSSRRLLLIL